MAWNYFDAKLGPLITRLIKLFFSLNGFNGILKGKMQLLMLSLRIHALQTWVVGWAENAATEPKCFVEFWLWMSCAMPLSFWVSRSRLRIL